MDGYEQHSGHIACENLRFCYPDGALAIEKATIAINHHERVALVGRNGSGKSTLMRLLSGLLPCQDGAIFYRGAIVAKKNTPTPLAGMGILFQDPDDHLFCNTVFEDVVFGLFNQGKSAEECRIIAMRQLTAVGLADKADMPPHVLSHGQKKRAALAAVLAMAPELLLLDEPAAGLDPSQIEAIAAILAEYSGTLIVIDHDLPFLARLCCRAVVLADGRIRHDMDMAELMRHPHNLREHGLDFTFRLTADQPPERDKRHRHYQPRHDHSNGLAHQNCQVEVPPIIELQHFSYHYPDGTRALFDINLGVQAGEKVALIGENGAGKSTLAACLLGLRLGNGQYFHHGQEARPQNRRDLWRRVGMVFQDNADQLFCPSCREEVAFGPRWMRLAQDEISRRVAVALAAVGLSGYEERVPLHLSGGERKRLAIASALAMEPELLILDEPTAGLDPAGQEILLRILENIRAAFLLITHDLFFARRLCSRAVLLHHGEIIRDDTSADFFNKIDNSYILS
ncbi:MAG: ATP-binding cassette domain-containing protein [Desulfobulbaceae bacterium]|jgi:energy-coupling factor transporter ATP-binding protein EcfA2|nr:ATP-binding cassette domain-containing protein [Desulfobulbaceae bacterium]